MRKFPPACDMQFLVGSELNLVKIARYSYQFGFLPDTNISVESQVDYVESDAIHTYNIQDKVGTIAFTELIGEKIVKLQAADFTLEMIFESGRMLRIISKGGANESGTIGSGDTYIVF